MPIYEYRCSECRFQFEKLIRTKDIASIKCPQCGADNTEKKFSAPAKPQVNGSSGSCSEPGSCSSGKCPFA